MQALTTSRQTRQQEDTRLLPMQILHTDPDISQREMTKALGISFGRVNFCLNALMAKGLVKLQNFSHSQNKFGYVYLLTAAGVAEKMALNGSFLSKKWMNAKLAKYGLASFIEVNYSLHQTQTFHRKSCSFAMKRLCSLS